MRYLLSASVLSDQIAVHFVTGRSRKMDWNYFGRNLGALRRKYLRLQKQVAIDSGFKASYIAALEGGRRGPPQRERLLRIVTALGASESERDNLIRSARLTQVARSIAGYAGDFPGAGAAMSLLELSADMSPSEIEAVQIILEGYRFRSYLSRRNDM